MSSNNIGRYELSYEEKKFKLEPELLGIAEALKYKLCHEIDMLKKFGKCDESNLDDIVVKLPRKDFNIKNNKLILDCPSLTAQEFERVLKPFLDNDLLCYNENEYFISCSIFAPIQDALYHSGLAKTDIDYCLIVGGSSLIPQVKEAISKYFSLSKLLHYPDAYSNQVAVARGAAYQALCLMLFNKGLYDPVTHDSIGIRTQKGFMELIPKGVSLPYPPNGYGINNELTIPETVHSGKTDIRIEIVSGSDSNTLLKKKWSIQGPVKKGESLCLEYKYDENQVLHLLIGLANNLENSQVFEETIEKPLTYVVNPNSIRQKILEIEEEIRCGIYTGQKLYEKIKEVARLYAEIGQYERAIDLLKKILSNSHQPDVNILNLLGIYCGNIGDYERQEKFYRKAAEVSSWKGPLFNLALSFWNRGKIDQAIEIIDEVIRDEKEAPYLVLKAKLLFEQKKVDKGRALLEEAFTLFEDIELLDDWSLYWYIDAARMLKDEEKINAAKNEQRRRMCSKDDDGGLLPDLTLRLKGR